MGRIIVSEWLTLDGVFDSRNEYFEKWFLPYHSEARGAYIKENILACDALLLGRHTFEMLAPYWSALKNNEMGIADKMNQAPKYVASATLKSDDPSLKGWNNTRVISGDLQKEVAALKRKYHSILTTGCGQLVASLMGSGLIDEYRFLIHPILMGGGGQRFFSEKMPVTRFELLKAEVLDHGLTLLCYREANKKQG